MTRMLAETHEVTTTKTTDEHGQVWTVIDELHVWPSAPAFLASVDRVAAIVGKRRRDREGT